MFKEDVEMLEKREAELRSILAGPCFYEGGRWFPSNVAPAEIEAYRRREERRRERNRRLNERRAAQRQLDAFEARIARLPPWTQTRLYGRTAVTTEIDGKLYPVDYDRTYGSWSAAYDLRLLNGSCTREFDELTEAAFRVYDGARGVFKLVSKGIASIGRQCSHRGPMLFDNNGEQPTSQSTGSQSGCQMQFVDKRIGYLTPEDERRSRLLLERRKVLRRSTVAECPTATDIRVRWELRRQDSLGVLKLGLLMMDLECYVDNSLVINDVEVTNGNGVAETRKMIVGRRGGLRQWITENCWELADKYKTLMRYKSLAKRLYQLLDVPDPLPLSEIFRPNADIAGLCAREVHIQPREFEHRNSTPSRFDWEQRPWLEDAKGRSYHPNGRYSNANPTALSPEWIEPMFNSVRSVLDRLSATIFDGLDSLASSRKTFTNNRSLTRYSSGNWNMCVIFERLDHLLAKHEKWWAEQSLLNSQSRMQVRL